MSASAQVHSQSDISCLQGSEVRFSFVVEVMPKKISFAPISYHLLEFRKAMGFQIDNYEDEFEDHDE